MIQEMSPLTAVFSEVLANMAFLFTEPPPDAPADPSEWLECCIQYRGSRRGSVALRTTPQFVRTLAANLLDLEPDSPEAAEQGRDALKELVNVFCGQLVTTLHGREQAFDLSIPALGPASGPEPAGDETVQLYVDGQPVRLTHVLEG